MSENRLMGTWQLVTWQITSSDGETLYPYGPDAIGFIMYTHDGYMSGTLMTAKRANFAGDDLFGGSDAEKAAAFESYLAYCGKYDFDGAVVTHYVQASMFPNWVGMDQVRFAEFGEGTVTLSTRPMLLNGKQQVARLVWKRE